MYTWKYIHHILTCILGNIFTIYLHVYLEIYSPYTYMYTWKYIHHILTCILGNIFTIYLHVYLEIIQLNS